MPTIDWTVPQRFWLFAGFDMLSQRRVLSLMWGWQSHASPCEEVWQHQLRIRAPRWPLIYYHDEAGRVWPAGVLMFGRCRLWKWHLPDEAEARWGWQLPQ